MNFADRMKTTATPKEEVAITKEVYSKACVNAMQRMLEDEKLDVMFEVLPVHLWVETLKLYAIAVREELFKK